MNTRVPVTQPLDLLRFPFTGAQVIEASAGTGKTWTLASLYLRLVLGHGLDGGALLPPRILVMTFTEAATKELRDRIRKRLTLAARYFRGQPDPQAETDGFLPMLRAQYAESAWPHCARQLETAAQWMDEAAIHTIHAWSHRMLREHAFDSNSLFEQERLEDPAALKLQAARDYWRRWVYPLDLAQSAAWNTLADSPEQLLQAVKRKLAAAEQQPADAQAPPAPAPPDPPSALAGWSAWRRSCEAPERLARERWAANAPQLEALIRAAVLGKHLNGRSYAAAKLDTYFTAMREWAAGGSAKRDTLERFSLARLTDKTNNGRTTPVDPPGAFQALQALCAVLALEPDLAPVLDHAAKEIRERCEARKRELAQFDFNDLLQRLHTAVQVPDGHLALAIRAQYPIALVDEFQDTDPWQYGTLYRIYRDPTLQGVEGALVMIGDPKQAIYSFRGADLKTYLRARRDADQIHTLTGNYRSTRALVAAVNHIFARAVRPFGDIPCEAVTANRDSVPPLLRRDGTAYPALTVWHESGPDTLGAEALRSRLAESFATQLVQLLADSQATTGDIAVLVRSGKEAALIRAALAARGVRSVYLSDRDSVFATPEALDLWYVLRAVAEPRSARHVRTALAARSFGLRVAELDELLRDEVAFERQVERFATWQQVWQRQGFLPMLYSLLHDQQIPRRLLAAEEGERRLTNLLHLGDLLQQASLEVQGEVAVVRHLAAQLQESLTTRDTEQMRLETDAQLVKVVTLHKAKGLQYKVTFLPFAYEFRLAQASDSNPDDAQRLEEDIRLLYVGLTRAESALFLGAATRSDEFLKDSSTPRAALSRLLGRESPQDLAARLTEWAHCPDIHVAPLPEAIDAPYVPPRVAKALRAALTPRRQHESAWRSSSFSSLTRHLAAEPRASLVLPDTQADERYQDAQADNPAGQEALLLPDKAYNGFPAGARYGDLLHGLLEWQLAHGWPILQSSPDTAAWQALFTRRCDVLGLDAPQREQLAAWIAAIARCPLGLAGADGHAVTLAGLAPTQTWAEMGFTLTTRGTSAQAVDAQVTARVLPGLARDALPPNQLEGLLTGYLDLVFEHAGRYYVLDYKSNRLADYSPPSLANAILEHRYDLQYTLYVVALHRLLRHRLPDYDFERHLGGAIYLFARGVAEAGNGVFADRPPRELIETLDNAFAGRGP